MLPKTQGRVRVPKYEHWGLWQHRRTHTTIRMLINKMEWRNEEHTRKVSCWRMRCWTPATGKPVQVCWSWSIDWAVSTIGGRYYSKALITWAYVISMSCLCHFNELLMSFQWAAACRYTSVLELCTSGPVCRWLSWPLSSPLIVYHLRYTGLQRRLPLSILSTQIQITLPCCTCFKKLVSSQHSTD